MSDEELSHLLFEVQQSAQKLNEASDSINSVVDSIEQKIVQANVGLECWLSAEPLHTSDTTQVAIGPQDDPGETWTDTILGFARIAGLGWRLVVRERVYIMAFDADETPSPILRDPSQLSRASRELRIKALEKMPALLKQLLDRVNGALEAIANAKKLAE